MAPAATNSTEDTIFLVKPDIAKVVAIGAAIIIAGDAILSKYNSLKARE
jgi:hypothetical protein